MVAGGEAVVVVRCVAGGCRVVGRKFSTPQAEGGERRRNLVPQLRQGLT